MDAANLVDAKLGKCVNCDHTIYHNGHELRHVEGDRRYCPDGRQYQYVDNLETLAHEHIVLTTPGGWFSKPKAQSKDRDVFLCPQCGGAVTASNFWGYGVVFSNHWDIVDSTAEQIDCIHEPMAEAKELP